MAGLCWPAPMKFGNIEVGKKEIEQKNVEHKKIVWQAIARGV